MDRLGCWEHFHSWMIILNIPTDTPLEGKTVLLVGGEGPLQLAVQCLIERSGMVTLKSHWSSKSLQAQVWQGVLTLDDLHCALEATYVKITVLSNELMYKECQLLNQKLNQKLFQWILKMHKIFFSKTERESLREKSCRPTAGEGVQFKNQFSLLNIQYVQLWFEVCIQTWV